MYSSPAEAEKYKKAEEAKKKLQKLKNIQMTSAALGNVIGLSYAFKTNRKFWGYVGFALLGGAVLSGVAYIATMPARNKAENDLITK